LVSKEVAPVMAGGISAELIDTRKVALESSFKSLTSKDVQAIKDLCTVAPRAR
jgi:hypothetical protein